MGSEKETFGLTGPSFLTAIDWNNSNHRRSIAATLVQGVYVLESDRQQNRQAPQALAPPWWEFFNFKLNRLLIDDHDQSYFGAIYEFNFPYPYPNYPGQRPPQYVLAFRGSINKSGTRAEDLKMNLNCMVNNLHDSRRFQIGTESAREIVSQAGPGNVWIAGHSIGSSIALLLGRHMAKNMGAQVETYLFNPPFASPPIERIKNEKVKLGLRLANSVLTAGLAMAASSKGQEKNDPFAALSSWIPYLFLNQSDMICSEYIGYFEHREKMESIGAGKIGRLATKHSLGSIVSAARGKDSEAAHLIPSAYLSINCSVGLNFKEAHGIHQWWKPDLELKYKLYQYK
ncbi:GDSL esterase/lipase at4g10955 [Phtheirospermum japonicum]|uniref:GDSL esterase/lipase at4g10955 n=1 Tax=Phtheirospermum japonicum TaxID=374723 RepID=A0A830B0R8_9LAMI|nr:GDSL esterase/lipase at4g10955 [Phtheirospermum japonicum]